MTPRQILPLAILALAAFLPFLTASRASEDLLSLWLAATALAADRADLVYAGAGPVFTMQPPSEEWLAMAAATGHDGHVYPYLYPPLWAALAAPLTGRVGFGAVEALATFANPVLLLATSWLAWRALRSPLPAVTFLLTGQVLFYVTTIGGIAILQNQPQILVAFLTVLAIERSRAGGEIVAGAALALAAAIKLYPLLLLPILLARGQTRAALAFLATGTAFGLASVLLAGWPLHAEFLAGVAAISGTVMKIPATYGLDTVLANFVPATEMTLVRAASLDATAAPGWLVMAKPAAWSWASRIAMLAMLILCMLAGRRLDAARTVSILWPVAIIALALLSPLAWCYYFIAALAFAPSFLTSYGARRAVPLLLVIALPVSLPVIASGWLAPDLQTLLGFAAMILLGLGFLFSPSQRRAAAQNGRTTLPE